jgi:hypothetical protein
MCDVCVTSYLIPHTSYLTPHTSYIIPHTSHITHHTSYLIPHTHIHTYTHTHIHTYLIGTFKGDSKDKTDRASKVCITTIDTIILNIHTNDAYIFDTFDTSHAS